MACNYWIDAECEQTGFECMYWKLTADICANAQPIVGGHVNINTMYACYTEDIDIPTGSVSEFGCNSDDGWCESAVNERDVFYNFTTPNDPAQVTIYTAGLATHLNDLRLAVFEGDCNGTLMGANDNWPGQNFNYNSFLQFTCGELLPNTLYTVMVSSSHPEGVFTNLYLDIDEICPGCTDPTAVNYDAGAVTDDGSCGYSPINDDCTGAIEVFEGDNDISNLFAGPDPSYSIPGTECDDITYSGWCPEDTEVQAGVFYKYTVPQTLFNSIEFTISYPPFGNVLNMSNSQIAVFDACDGNLIAANDDSNPLTHATVTIQCADLVPGAEYIILFDGHHEFGITDIGLAELTITVYDQGGCGCTDPTACNYNMDATEDDGSCTYPGCTSTWACNYDPNAGCDDGSCSDSVGCTDPLACNYISWVICDDGSCSYTLGCAQPLADNYDPSILNSCDDGACTYSTPSNDDCANPMVVSEGSTLFHNFLATPDPSYSIPGTDCEDQDEMGWCPEDTEVQAGLFFSFTTPEFDFGTLTISCSNTGPIGGAALIGNTQLAVYDACNGNLLAANDDSGLQQHGRVRFDCDELGQNTELIILVDSKEINGSVNYGYATLIISMNTAGESVCHWGCTDPVACNYDSNATVDNGTCDYDSCLGLYGYRRL